MCFYLLQRQILSINVIHHHVEPMRFAMTVYVLVLKNIREIRTSVADLNVSLVQTVQEIKRAVETNVLTHVLEHVLLMLFVML